MNSFVNPNRWLQRGMTEIKSWQGQLSLTDNRGPGLYFDVLSINLPMLCEIDVSLYNWDALAGYDWGVPCLYGGVTIQEFGKIGHQFLLDQQYCSPSFQVKGCICLSGFFPTNSTSIIFIFYRGVILVIEYLVRLVLCVFNLKNPVGSSRQHRLGDCATEWL